MKVLRRESTLTPDASENFATSEAFLNPAARISSPASSKPRMARAAVSIPTSRL